MQFYEGLFLRAPFPFFFLPFSFSTLFFSSPSFFFSLTFISLSSSKKKKKKILSSRAFELGLFFQCICEYTYLNLGT